MNDSRKVEVFLNRVTIAKSGDVVRLHCDDAEHAEQLFEFVNELFQVSDGETCQHLEVETEGVQPMNVRKLIVDLLERGDIELDSPLVVRIVRRDEIGQVTHAATAPLGYTYSDGQLQVEESELVWRWSGESAEEERD